MSKKKKKKLSKEKRQILFEKEQKTNLSKKKKETLSEKGKGKIEFNGWIYFIGEDGLKKAKTDGSEMTLLYKCTTYPTFSYDYLKEILEVDDEWVHFVVQSELYRVKDDPDDPYSEASSYVDRICYKIKLDGTELTKEHQSAMGVGTFSEP
jgi:hypothetical protein